MGTTISSLGFRVSRGYKAVSTITKPPPPPPSSIKAKFRYLAKPTDDDDSPELATTGLGF